MLVVCGQLPGKLKPALTPEHDIHQDNLRPQLLCPPQRLSRGRGNADDTQALPFQAIAGSLKEQPVVVHNQDTEHRHVNSVPVCTVPRIGASRNRQSAYEATVGLSTSSHHWRKLVGVESSRVRWTPLSRPSFFAQAMSVYP